MKKLLPLFLLSLLVFSCQEDDSFSPSADAEKENGGYQRKVINFGQMKSALSPNAEKLTYLFSDGLNKGEDYIQAIDTTYIVTYSNDTLTTYTLRVRTLDDELYSFSNLIIKQQNGETEESVIHYTPTENWQTAHDNGEYLPYEGELAVTNLQGQGSGAEGKYGFTECVYTLIIVYSDDGCSCGNDLPSGYRLVLTCYTSGGGGSGGDNNPDNPDDPLGGGGYPTDPVAGDWGSGSGNLTLCQILNMKIAEVNFKQKINQLKTKVNLPNEHGYVNQNPSEDPNINSNATNTYNPTISKTRADGKPQADMLIEGPQVFGYMHTHPNSPTMMGVHSTPDIRTFASIIRQRSGFNYSLSEAYGIVVGNHGVYALKLENFTKFNNWMMEVDTRKEYDKYFDDLEDYYYEIREHENTRTNNERSVLKVLNKVYNDLGVGIYRAKDDLSGWERMSLDANGDPDFTRCN